MVAVLPLAACLETDLTLKPDGSVSGTVSWMPSKKLPEGGVKAVLDSPGVTVKRVELADLPEKDGRPPVRPQRVTAHVEATSVKTLITAPLFRVLQVSADLGQPEGGKRKLTVRASSSEGVGPVPETDNVVRLHLPGPVAETSAKATGNDVTWTIPGKEFTTKKAVELSVVYTEAPAAAEKTEKK